MQPILIAKQGREQRVRTKQERMEVERVLGELRESFDSGRTRSLSWRQAQLRALSRILHTEEEGIFGALQADLGKHRAEAFKDEVGPTIKSVDHALKNVKRWMAPTKAAVPMVAFPSSAEVVPEPLGVVLIFSSWNFPIGRYKVLHLWLLLYYEWKTNCKPSEDAYFYIHFMPLKAAAKICSFLVNINL